VEQHRDLLIGRVVLCVNRSSLLSSRSSRMSS
jgi:hypothetical protein